MSKRHLGLLLLLFALFLAAGMALGLRSRGGCSWHPSMVRMPAGSFLLGTRDPSGQPVREVALAAFEVARTETTTGQFALFLNAAGTRRENHPQFAQDRGKWNAKAPCEPVAHVTRGEAEAYCRWLGKELGTRVRLPTEDEWEAAARGGIRGAPYPWGWEDPAGRACFQAPAAAQVGSYAASSTGLYDFSGNVAEWCQNSAGSTGVVARGGSFAERDLRRVAVWSRVHFAAEYRDADVGFRIVIER